MLDSLNVHSFTPYVGEIFEVPFDDGTVVHLKLTVATPFGYDEATLAAGRSFRLLFEAAGPPYLKQGTFAVHHRKLGELPIFLVPVGVLPGGLGQYEAVFHRT